MRERAFLEALRPAFSDDDQQEQRLYVGGAASLLVDAHRDELAGYRDLLEVLEQRAALLEVLRAGAPPRGGRSFASVTSSTTRRCARSPWWAPATASPTGRSER